jgi:RNA polymerase sigma factor (TIGR02999 family)
MSDVTFLLDAAAAGDRKAAADLLPVVYDELRKLAAARMDDEAPGNTLNATALVHEAYLRLVGSADDVRWENRGHFFAAAAEAMRRILVESTRRKKATKHGGGLHRLDVTPAIAAPEVDEDLVAIDGALDRLAALDLVKAELVKFRYFESQSGRRFRIDGSHLKLRLVP